MEELPRLKARISSLQELRDLIRALRALAASRVQEAQGTLPGIRKYVEAIEGAIAEGVGLLPKAVEVASGGAMTPRSALMVVCSEHGFAGALNSRLFDRAEAALAPEADLVVIGARGAALAYERGLAPTRTFAMATHVGGIMPLARQVADYLAALPTADVVFARYQRGGDFEVELEGILPLAPALLLGAERRSPPLHHLAADVLLQRLASEYLLAEITRALMESLASENGARLLVMENADRNIADKLEGLRRNERQLRQEATTEELLDLVTGAEALLSRSP